MVRQNSNDNAELPLDSARKKLLTALTRRGLSEWEAARKLADWHVAQDDSRTLIAEFVRCGYLDDRRFADSFLRARISRGYGMIRIRQEMMARGLSPKLIDEVTTRFQTDDAESSESNEMEVAEREWRKLASCDPETRKRRWFGRMQRRGFSTHRLPNLLRTLERQEKTNGGRKTSGGRGHTPSDD